MRKKFAFILPYIGKLPSWFQLWLHSCARNPIADWLLFTDDHSSLEYPENVKVHYCSFEDLKVLFQKSFPFTINLEHPYRFCDFKPSFGLIFKDFIAGYDFWGHCDPDLLWGDLKKWLNNPAMDNYDRISHWGHCSLYRNSQEMNNLFKTKIEGIAFYKDVYSENRHIAFDEEYGMNIMTREKGIKEFILPFFDVKPAIQSFSFTPTFVSEPFFPQSWSHIVSKVSDEGVAVFGINSHGLLMEKQFAYIHLQKRKMKIKVDMNENEYLIVPNSFIPIQKVDLLTLKKLTPNFYGDFVKRKTLVWNSRVRFLRNALFSKEYE